MKNMRLKYWFSFLILGSVLVFACKKDKSNQSNKYISKIYKNGLLEYEFLYDSKRRPFRRNSFAVGFGQSKFASYRIYQYNSDGNLVEVDYFDKGNEIQQIFTLNYGVNGELTRANQANENGVVNTYFTYQYNQDGTIASILRKSANNNQTNGQNFFFYNNDRLLVKWLRTNLIGNNFVPVDSTNYKLVARYPVHWNYFEMNFAISAFPNSDAQLLEMYADTSMNYRYDAPPQITTRTYSNRVGGTSFPTSVSQALKIDNGGVITNSIIQYSYEYIDLD